MNQQSTQPHVADDLTTFRMINHYLKQQEEAKEEARKLDPRNLANPPHKPPKFDIRF